MPTHDHRRLVRHLCRSVRNVAEFDVHRTGQMPVEVFSSLADVEQQVILATLEHCENDKRRAADVLGVSLKTLYNRLNVYKAV